MTKAASRGLVLAASLVAGTGSADPESTLPELRVLSDPRVLRIKEYFLARDCPAHAYAQDFVHAADWHQLDWRLLPSLSMVESTGGKEFHNNNMFGWGNSKVRFDSPREGIYKVAARLRNSKLYRDKSLDKLLWTYNPVENYPAKVRTVMDHLGPRDLAPAGVF